MSLRMLLLPSSLLVLMAVGCETDEPDVERIDPNMEIETNDVEPNLIPQTNIPDDDAGVGEPPSADPIELPDIEGGASPGTTTPETDPPATDPVQPPTLGGDETPASGEDDPIENPAVKEVPEGSKPLESGSDG